MGYVPNRGTHWFIDLQLDARHETQYISWCGRCWGELDSGVDRSLLSDKISGSVHGLFLRGFSLLVSLDNLLGEESLTVRLEETDH